MNKIIAQLVLCSMLFGSFNSFAETQSTCSELYVQRTRDLYYQFIDVTNHGPQSPEKSKKLQEADDMAYITGTELTIGLTTALLGAVPSPVLLGVAIINMDAARAYHQNAGNIAIGTAVIGAVLGAITLIKYEQAKEDSQKYNSEYSQYVIASRQHTRKIMEIQNELNDVTRVTNLFLEIATEKHGYEYDSFVKDVIYMNPRLSLSDIDYRLDLFFQGGACNGSTKLSSMDNLKKLIATTITTP